METNLGMSLDEACRRLVDQAPDGIYIGREGRVRFINPAFQHLMRAASPSN